MEPTPPNSASFARLSAFHAEMKFERRLWKTCLSILTSSAMAFGMVILDWERCLQGMSEGCVKATSCGQERASGGTARCCMYGCIRTSTSLSLRLVCSRYN